MTDKEILRGAAAEYMKLASRPVMKEKEKAWRACHNLRPLRPVYFFETFSIIDFIDRGEIKCGDPYNRGLENYLKHCIRHVQYCDDDMVLKPYYEIDWEYDITGWGPDLQFSRNENAAVISNHPIKEIADISRLQKRIFCLNRERTYARQRRLNDMFGDILPVKINGPTWYVPALTKKLFDFIGMENIYFWMVDEPAAIHKLMRYFTDDAIRDYRSREKEGVLGFNNCATIVTSGSYGLADELPASQDKVRKLSDVWGGMESQETETVSPEMFSEFFLPYMAEVAKLFGLNYYGCCEHLHDRIDAIIKAIPNIRSVSVSPWSDRKIMHEKLGDKRVFSLKPVPSHISGKAFNMDAVGRDIGGALDMRKGMPLEIIYRDVYDIDFDYGRLTQWSDLMKKKIGM